MLDLGGGGGTTLPKNLNGIRTTHTCELCGFEPKTKNKYREKQDHLVMKHFKEQIDKIFPHCRPYTCPTPDCNFTGKDKQALLRHYTGKHGILEKYLKEALAEKGINYIPGEHGSKRRYSTSSEGGNSGKAIKQVRMNNSPPAMINPKDFLPNTPVPIITRQNTEELRKEVEAMMASFQPQSMEPILLSLPPQAQIVNVQMPSEPVLTTTTNSAAVQMMNSRHQMPIKVELPQHPTNVSIVTTSTTNSVLPPPNFIRSTIPITTSQHQLQQHHLHQNHQQTQLPPFILTTSSTGQLIMTSRSPMTLPPLISQSTTAASMPMVTSTTMQSVMSSLPQSTIVAPTLSNIPHEMMYQGMVTSSSSSSSSSSSTALSNGSTSSMMNSDGSILDNDEIMWGAGPAVVVEAADTVPITYIETVDGTYVENIDYDILIPGTNGLDVRERQLDFCML